MGDTLVGLRNILRREQTVRDGPRAVDPPEERARRLAEHERRIHNHPCPCGSGLRYAECCIDRINQEHLELRHRRQMGLRDEDL
ncbi:MAG: SEC-C domain-containing protein [Phycisphaerae bacterium]|nr:SEC-C domain-containing protein [Phycisphaerae bacterium]